MFTQLLSLTLSALMIVSACGELPQTANADRGTGRIAAADCDKGSRECFPEETVQPT
jgi:hypothetical protein